jgi:hypothetical protein
MQEEKWHTVQPLVVKNVRVKALDEIQAEVAAFRSLKPNDRDAVVLTRVLETGDEHTEVFENPREAINKFYRPDRDWINASL